VLDRVPLAAGGRRWLARSFHRILTLLPTTIGAATLAVSASSGDQER
jgi:hypothetical protein